MKRFVYLLCPLTLVMLGVGCGGGAYINKSFQYEPHSASIKLALIPAMNEEEKFIDSMSVELYDDTTFLHEIVPPADIRNAVYTDEKLRGILNRLGSAEYSSEDFKRGPSILDDVSSEERAYLTTALGGADLALFPVVFSMSNLGHVTSGWIKMRLYDLNSGELIYEKKQNLLVEGAGELGPKLLAIQFLGFAKEDYRQYFWNKFMMQ